jgi:hypothetical protein
VFGLSELGAQIAKISFCKINKWFFSCGLTLLRYTVDILESSIIMILTATATAKQKQGAKSFRVKENTIL